MRRTDRRSFAVASRAAKTSVPVARRLQRSHAPLSFWLQWLALVTLILGSMVYVVDFVAGGVALPAHKIEAALGLALTVIVYPRLGIFRRLRLIGWSLAVMTTGWIAVSLMTYATLYYCGIVSGFDQVFMCWAGLVMILQPAIVLGCRLLLRFHSRAGALSVRTAVIGEGQLALNLVERLQSNPYLQDQLVGMVAQGEPTEAGRALRSKLPQLGMLDDLAEIVLHENISRVYVALPIAESARVVDVQNMLDGLNVNVDVVWVPDFCALTLLNPAMKELSGLPLLSLSESPLSYFSNAYLKSLFDLFVASIVLIITSPILLVAAIAVKLSSPGPILYCQLRHGWDGSVFRIYKFRSMYVHAESEGKVTQAKQNDSRVTPVGRFLRKTSLDELPQLFNVIEGTMSLVGPRPHALAHNYDYAREIKTYFLRHRIKPGITGLAQIRGWRGETATVDKMRHRVDADLAYINDWSLWRDVLILLRTPLALIRNKVVY